jgi:hypothetical protein
MNPWRMLVLAIVILMALPAMARAQSDSDDIVAGVTVLAAIDVTGTTDLNFGSVLQSSGVIRSSDVPTVGTWTVQNLPNFPPGLGPVYDISFSLPTVLQNPGATAIITIQFADQSAVLNDGIAPPVVFNPAAGLQTQFLFSSPSSLTITLGEDLPGNGTGDVTINVLDVPPDTYSGVITLTVAIL